MHMNKYANFFNASKILHLHYGQNGQKYFLLQFKFKFKSLFIYIFIFKLLFNKIIPAKPSTKDYSSCQPSLRQ
jgi:hypothetical protein